jgi:ribonuclease P protein component
MARSAQAEADEATAARSAWRSLKSADFALALSAPALAKSPHFMLHHLAAEPVSSTRSAAEALVPELSTDAAPNRESCVDNYRAPRHWWLGLVVPKRHARRSVTRSLIKREMRAHAEGHRESLPAGQWLIRLRAPFDPTLFTSAASANLREAARKELERVFSSVVRA